VWPLVCRPAPIGRICRAPIVATSRTSGPAWQPPRRKTQDAREADAQLGAFLFGPIWVGLLEAATETETEKDATYVRAQVVGAHRGHELAQKMVQFLALDVAVSCWFCAFPSGGRGAFRCGRWLFCCPLVLWPHLPHADIWGLVTLSRAAKWSQVFPRRVVPSQLFPSLLWLTQVDAPCCGSTRRAELRRLETGDKEGTPRAGAVAPVSSWHS